ncbi:hypothetical protein [Actinomadura sp. SCN-SB]|uniref:hypothetical protein n=1 Tax=Actinomadura sp. SCN-SB TaxID=3373092 RepID=UPI003751CCAC
MNEKPIRPTPAQWPGGELEAVRAAAAAAERADRRAQFERLQPWTRERIEYLAEALEVEVPDDNAEYASAYRLGYLTGAVRALLWEFGLIEDDER